ncbi:hypothetical protein A3H38_05230 [candidate division WOR-1 bacterium RIFCSPLOWO2_02_FULL_46_20]|uniref:Uncharacterized protein n=1 Tax=candidate division WOR-1 bacterium RIFCSPLOWO2_02_FULL_46_20 TaxID=1802567 RepID=A0A1F4RDU9_UNCSA|nr:MAG: hypothetical protein A3H38_05230 [candidate division WOR-1 bacterium RIFCSPLOWO2_02_FULL_46_20]
MAITAKTSSGGIIRAAEAIKRLPHLIAAGIRVEIRTPGGNLLDNSALIGKIPKQIDALARGVDTLIGIDQLRKGKSVGIAEQAGKRSEMIDDSRLPFKVAIDVLPGFSLVEGREKAAERNEQDGGKRRIPTEPELLELNRLLGDRLEGSDDWIWTETEHEDYPGQFVLRRQDDDGRGCSHPGSNYYYSDVAVRFVEDR